MATAKTLCNTVFTATGCRNPHCPCFHPDDPVEVYHQIATFAVQVKKSSSYVDPLAVAWNICADSTCSEATHVHASPVTKDATVRPLYDVLLARAHKKIRGAFIHAQEKEARKQTKLEVEAWRFEQEDNIRSRLYFVSASLEEPGLRLDTRMA